MISDHFLFSTFSMQQVEKKWIKGRSGEFKGAADGRRSATGLNLSQVFHDDMF